jgi:hypothetical protein
MKFLRIVGIWFLFLPLAGSLPAQHNWVVKKEKDNIKISGRHSDRSRFDDLRVEMDLPGNIYQLADILIDVQKYTQWSYATKKSEVVKRISPIKLIYYSEMSVPWPATNRDFYAGFEETIDAASRSLKVVSYGMKDYKPPAKDLIRIPYSRAVWNISTISDKIIHLDYILEFDPGGSVPVWILNLFATKAPMETFSNLKQKMVLLNP